MRSFRSIIFLVTGAVGLSMSTCESDERPSDTGGANDADADTDADADADGDGAVCEEQPFFVTREGGRLMILQDVSYSMSLKVPETAPTTKWEEARAALQGVLGNPAFASVEFGFDTFPDWGACQVDILQEDTKPQAAGQISSWLDTFAIAYEADTPLYCALANYLDSDFAPLFSKPDKPRYLLVVSDGQPTCDIDCENTPTPPSNYPLPADLLALSKNLAASGIKTFVIGFHYSSKDDPEFLDQIAAGGGTGTDVILAEDQAALQKALEQVAGKVVSCLFSVNPESANADPNKVNFYFDKEVVPLDDNCASGTGWQWTDDHHTIIEFCAESCAELRAGNVDEVSARWGCKTIVI